MNILISGGAGFIGSSLALRLVRDGHAVTVLDNLSQQVHGDDPARTSALYRSIAGIVRFIHGSVCDESVWGEALSDQDAVVHLVAETGTGQSMYEIRRYTEVSIGGTALMLGWLARNDHRVRRMVVASSRAAHGEGRYVEVDGTAVYPGPRRAEDLQAGRFEPLSARDGHALRSVPTDEDSAIHPCSVYGITKLNQEQMTMTVCPTSKIEPVALRFRNVYGPGQSLKNPYTGILSIFATRVLNGNAIEVFEGGLESRDFVFIDDVVESLCLGLFRPEAVGQVFGIGSSVATSVLAVARELTRCHSRDVPIKVTGAFRVGDICHNCAHLGKAEGLLGFRPRTDFSSGLQAFSERVPGQEIAEDTYDRSIREMRDKGLFNS